MGKSVAALLLLAFLTASCLTTIKPVSAGTEDSWVPKAPMQEARANFGIAVVNGKIYAFGGDSGSPMGNAVPAEIRTANTVSTNEEYDPSSDTWTFKKSMPTARALLGVAVYQSKVYCIGGYYGERTTGKTNYFNTGVNEVYDPATDTWETRAAMPKVDSRFATANVVNGKIYVISAALNQAYDPETDSWTTKTPPLYGISVPGVSVVFDNKIYFIGTRYSAEGFFEGYFIQTYNPANDSWTIIDEASIQGLSGTAGATTGVNALKRIYFFDETETNIYDPESNTWTVGASKSARYLARVAVVNDVFYVVGGRTGQVGYVTWLNPSVVNEQYTPIGYGTPDPSYVPPDSTVPEISVMSPENETCYTTNVLLSFTVNEPDTWMRYKLDGKTVVEVEGNSTLAGLSAGLHSVTIFVTDAAGNTAASETIYFTVDDTTPVVSVTAPENKTYKAAEVPLNFTVNEKVSRMEYSLDSQPNVQITGNTTLTGLSNGAHNLTVYARDVAGNTGVSETIYFNVDVPAPFPVAPVAVASGAAVVFIGVGLLVYFKKRKH